MAILKDLIVHGSARIMNTLFARKVIADEFEGSIKASNVAVDSTHRFTTDTEKTTWNGKASTAVASQSANGLMAAADKRKLDGIATGANNYVHPSTHPATMISQDTTHRFVSDADKTNWNDANSKKHSHSNKGVLDTITQAMLDKVTRGEFIEIPDVPGLGLDLDDYREPGIYYYNSPFVGETSVANSPMDPYVMFVFPFGFFEKKILQLLLMTDPISANSEWYFEVRARTYDIDTSTWERWRSMNNWPKSYECTLKAANWSNTAPYTQTMNISGIDSVSNPTIALDIPDKTTPVNESTMLKAYSCLSNATTDVGTITFKCISKKPTTDFNIIIKL